MDAGNGWLNSCVDAGKVRIGERKREKGKYIRVFL